MNPPAARNIYTIARIYCQPLIYLSCCNLQTGQENMFLFPLCPEAICNGRTEEQHARVYIALLFLHSRIELLPSSSPEVEVKHQRVGANKTTLSTKGQGFSILFVFFLDWKTTLLPRRQTKNMLCQNQQLSYNNAGTIHFRTLLSSRKQNN